jgi:hypothetical protein
MALQRNISRQLAVALAGIVLLGGCEGLNPETEPQSIGADESVIRFEHQDFDPERAEYLLHRNPRSANDVYFAQFAGSEAYATLVAVKTGPSHVIDERSVESSIGRLLQNSELTWGESGRVDTAAGTVPYRMFRIADQPVSCVGFSQSRGESSDDRGRKNDLVFGYFCQSNTRPMSAETASDLISRVSLVGRR